MIAKNIMLICLVTVGHLVVISQERRHDEPISDELYAMVQKRSNAITAELAGPPVNKWAGVYWDGDHHPTVFSWAPESGFLVTSSLHTFSPSWVNFGKVKFEANRLTIFPELAKDQKSAHIMPTEFVPVLWDDWCYLVPADNLLGFAYAVHSGSESQLGLFFAKRGSGDNDRKGLPDLPKQYTKIMSMPAIIARVVKVESSADGFYKTLISLDAGRRKGLTPGMQFYYAAGSRRQMMFRVETVGETRSTAKISMIAGSGENIRPRLGWRVSSKMPRGFFEPE